MRAIKALSLTHLLTCSLAHLRVVLEFALTPANLQLIFDRLDSVDTADEFLGHLLVVKRTDGAFESDVAAAGFYLHLARREKVTLAEYASQLF